MDNIVEPTADAGPDGLLTCSDTNATLTGSGTGTSPNVSFEWFNSTGALLGTTATIDVVETGDFTFVVTDLANGCSQTDVVTVEPDVNQPDIVIDVPETLTCDVTSVTLDASGSTAAGAGSLAFMWTFNGSPVGPTASIDVTVSGEYTLTVIDDSNNCDAVQTVFVMKMWLFQHLIYQEVLQIV